MERGGCLGVGRGDGAGRRCVPPEKYVISVRVFIQRPTANI